MPKIAFNVDAYTAKLIGRENVSRLDGAILELVKNTYDADASICFLYYEEETDSLYIGDNGTGMTTSTIMKHWMTIGSSSKNINFKTQTGRIQTGAKGIGRFALDRVADKCTLLTISNEEQLTWSVDWSTFEFGQNITDITAELSETSNSFLDFIKDIANKELNSLISQKFKHTGSIFRLNNLRDEWNDKTINSIKSNLKNLIPPELKEVFNIYFFESKTKIDQAALLQEDDDFEYDYRIEFQVHNNGDVVVQMERREFDFGDDIDEICQKAGFSQKEKDYFLGQPIIIKSNFSDILDKKKQIENTIGEFEGSLYFTKLTALKEDKEKYFYKDITGRTNVQKIYGGIRIYRDSFRVRPYGEPGTAQMDWLMLAARRNRSPAGISHSSGRWRVASNQVHGSIFISRINTKLVDQANRQGFVETIEFSYLKDIICKIIELFERDRQTVCKKLDLYYKETHPTFQIEKRIEEIKKNNRSETEQLPAKEVLELVSKKESEIKDLETEIQLLRALATTGIVANTYIHEVKQTVHTLEMNIGTAKEALIKNNPEMALKYIEKIYATRNSLDSWFDVTIESVRKDKRKMKNIDIKTFTDELILNWENILEPKKIKLESALCDINFKCFPYEFECILSNLIANSASSFEQYFFENRLIRINISPSERGVAINYSDNGNGLSAKYKENPRLILEPFESNKQASGGEDSGTGMGMWIINRIVTDYQGSIDLSENKKHETGFYIKIILNNKQ